jgi:hypothetical protein
MRWTLATPFVASINFHEGALVANYPWDAAPREQTQVRCRCARGIETSRQKRCLSLMDSPCKRIGRLWVQAGYAAAPDDATFRRLARAYADHHVAMAASKRFRHGITNGNKWCGQRGQRRAIPLDAYPSPDTASRRVHDLVNVPSVTWMR